MKIHTGSACENYEALLEDYLSGELDGSERVRIRSIWFPATVAGSRWTTQGPEIGSWNLSVIFLEALLLRILRAW